MEVRVPHREWNPSIQQRKKLYFFCFHQMGVLCKTYFLPRYKHISVHSYFGSLGLSFFLVTKSWFLLTRQYCTFAACSCNWCLISEGISRIMEHLCNFHQDTSPFRVSCTRVLAAASTWSAFRTKHYCKTNRRGFAISRDCEKDLGSSWTSVSTKRFIGRLVLDHP